jgi:hypothetical protein
MFVFVKRHAFKNRHHKMMVMTDDITHEDKVKCEQPLVEFTDRISTFMATMGSTDAAKLDINWPRRNPLLATRIGCYCMKKEAIPHGIVDDLLINGIITESTSAYASPVLQKKKKDFGDNRNMCVDCRRYS